MDSAPCSAIYFWLIKSVRFFSLLCTVCQVHYLLTHKSSSLAKGKFPLCCEVAASLCHKLHVYRAASSTIAAGTAAPQDLVGSAGTGERTHKALLFSLLWPASAQPL